MVPIRFKDRSFSTQIFKELRESAIDPRLSPSAERFDKEEKRSRPLDERFMNYDLGILFLNLKSCILNLLSKGQVFFIVTLDH